MAEYPHTIARPITDYLGEYLSVLSYGTPTNGNDDDAPFINQAIADLASMGGRDLYFPGGRVYTIKTPIVLPAGVNRVRLVGDGAASLIKRGANMPQGMGMFDIRGSDVVEFSNLLIDGNVLTPTGVLSSAINGDPMNTTLTANSTFWIHGGSSYIRLYNVTVTHTGGYAVLLDATAGDIDDVRIENCLFENNRPHLFGTVSGDLNYGSWTGGVHAQGDGTSYSVNGLMVVNSTFKRVTGNALWSHSYALNAPHTNFRFIGNSFLDCGLDGIQLGAVTGGVVESNNFRRIGYVTTDDTSQSIPRWNPNGNAYAVGLDTAGRVRGVSYKGNTFISCNGGCIDLDGFAQGTVSANTALVPSPADPEYTEDQIGSATWGAPRPVNFVGTWNPNWVYGAQVSNSNNDAIAGDSVVISGNTFVNCGGGGVRIYASRNGMVVGNNIIHSNNAPGSPITIGNLGTGVYQRSYGNVVSDNRINWSPASYAAAIYEDTQYGAFASTDQNWILNNKIITTGTAYEFKKSSTSGSVTRMTFSSATASQDRGNETLVQREGNWDAGYIRWYANIASASTSVMTLADTGILNVSLNGAANTGAISTGNRTSIGVKDSVNTGKVLADAFFIISAGTYVDADANKFGSSYGLLRWNATNKQIEQSVSIDGSGNRVWTVLGGTAIGGTNMQVQWNNNGVLGGSANFYWNNTTQILTVVGKTGNYGLLASGCYISSDQGFYSPYDQGNAVNLPNGGVTSKSVTVTGANYNAVQCTGTSATTTADFGGFLGYAYSLQGRAVAPPLSGAGTVKMYATSGGVLQISQNGGAWSGLLTSGANTFNGDQTINGKVAIRKVGGITNLNVGDDTQSKTATSGWAVTAWSDGSVYYDHMFTGATNYRYTVIDGANLYLATWAQLRKAVGTQATQFELYDTQLIVGGTSGGQGILLRKGWVDAPAFYTSSTNYNAYDAPNGGLSVRVASSSLYTQVGNSAGDPAAPTGWSLAKGAITWNTTSNQLRVYGGSGWLTVLTSGNTVSSVAASGYSGITGAVTIAAGTNVTLSQSGSTITINSSGSVPPNITCTTLVANSALYNAIQVTGGGGVAATSVQGFGTNENAVSAPSGGMVASSGYYVGNGSSWYQVINSNKQFVGFGIVMAEIYGVTAGGFNPVKGGLNYTGYSAPAGKLVRVYFNDGSFVDRNLVGGVIC